MASQPQICYRYEGAVNQLRPIRCLPAGIGPKTPVFAHAGQTVVDSIRPDGASYHGSEILCYNMPGAPSQLQCLQPGQLPPVGAVFRHAQ